MRVVVSSGTADAINTNQRLRPILRGGPSIPLLQQKRVALWLHDDSYEFDLHWRLNGLNCPVKVAPFEWTCWKQEASERRHLLL